MPDLPISVLVLLVVGVAASAYALTDFFDWLCRKWTEWRDRRRMHAEQLKYVQHQALRGRIAELEEREQLHLDEIKMLSRRNDLMGRALRSDPKAPTEVFQQSKSGRFPLE